ncbi:MAG TPA: hypothetical protein VG096_24520 [Bryobacteraceae bacterium]|jgi:hypothetical protein|nr:hypothetical protein [Bryobacteraceae bacterium]
MKAAFYFGAALCAIAVASAAESHTDRGKRVVNEALQALGGDAYLKLDDRVESGRAYSFYREQLSGLSIAKIYTRYLVPAPGQLSVRERQAFGKDEYTAVLFNEMGAWELTFRGARPLPDLRYAQYKDSTLRNIFYILRERLDEPGMIFYSQGSDIFQNVPVEIVDITDADNRTVTVYFDQRTKLPLRQSFRRRNEELKDWDVEVSLFTKYREVGGVKWPFDIHRERNGEKVYEIFSDSVEINKDLTDDLFTLPANLKLLPKAK